jgi:hypothetical protein
MNRRKRYAMYKAETRLRLRASQLMRDIQAGKCALKSKTRKPKLTTLARVRPKPKSKLNCG